MVIYGGSDDTRNVNHHPAFYTNLCVLDLITHVWINVLVKGSSLKTRCSHVACITKSKYIIFGGMNDKGMLSPQVKYFDIREVRCVEFVNKGRKFLIE